MSRLGRLPLLLLAVALLTPLLLTGRPQAAPPEPPAEKAIPDAAAAPFLEKAWSQPTIRESATRNVVLEQAPKSLQGRGLPVIGAFRPLGVGDKVVFRSFWGVHAVDLASGKLDWEADSRWGLDAMLREPAKASYVNQWLSGYTNLNQGYAVLDNSVVGSLASDGKFVFAVDDLVLGPFGAQFNPYQPVPPGGPGYMNFGPPVADAVNHNSLQAFDLATGKLIWEQGDKAGDAEFKNTFFLGAPLLHEGKLYTLNEKESRLRLVCLDPKTGHSSWQLDLASFRSPLSQDSARRRHAGFLVLDKGVIVCPTNAGSVVGVDLASRTLMWAYSYRETDPRQAPQFDPNNPDQAIQPPFPVQPGQFSRFSWKAAPPHALDGKVVFTAPDGQSVECIDILDGSMAWKVKANQDDVYLADAFAGNAIVVGRKGVRALNMADGKQAWSVETGEPSGFGVRADGVYYLPVKSAPGTKEPEVVALDLARGRILAHAPSRKREVPGNLFLHEGYVLSQTTGELVAYPQLQAKLKQIDRLLGANPKDPAGLVERGELRLAKGDVQGAADDLRTALAQSPGETLRERARRVLHETLAEALQRDFTAAEKDLAEFEKLCVVTSPQGADAEEREKAATEEKRRKSDFLFIMARGREQQGRKVDALKAYLDFLAVGRTEEVITSPDDASLKAPRDVLVGGRITALLAKADAKERADLEAVLREAWKKIQAGKDQRAAERFVRVFGIGSATGREARLWLGGVLGADRAFAEAELALLQVVRRTDSPADAARALDVLGGLYAQQGLLDDAAYCYRRIKDEFGAVPVRDGKTGAEVFQDMLSDKRLAALLAPPEGTPKVKVTDQRGQGAPNQYTNFLFESDGGALPYFRRYRPSLDIQMHQFKLQDRVGNQAPWSINLTRTNFQNLVYQNNPQGYPTGGHHAFQTAGHVVVLQLAHMVFAIDPVNRKLLWEKNLVGTGSPQNFATITQDPRDGAVMVYYPDGFTQRLGQLGPVDESQVLLLTRDGLTAYEPLTGAVVWSRADVSASAHMFGDGEHVFLVELGPDGKPTGSRAFRAADGASVKAADFSAAFARRLSEAGRLLLLTDDRKGAVVLRAHDPLTGQDAWSREFPAGSLVLKSVIEGLTGAVDREGKLTVLDATTGKEVVVARMDPKHLEDAQAVHLWRDATQVYAAVKGKEDPQQAQFRQFPVFVPGSGLRQLAIDGMVYAFDMQTGKLRWRAEAFGQSLLLDPLQEQPVLWFAGRGASAGAPGVPRMFQPGIAIRVVDKRTGKFLYDQRENNQNTQLLTLTTNPETGASELLGVGLKVTATVER